MDEDLIEEERERKELFIQKVDKAIEEEKEKRELFTWQGVSIVSILLWYVYYFIAPHLSVLFNIGKTGIWIVMAFIFFAGTALYKLITKIIRKDTSLKAEKKITVILLCFAICFWVFVWVGVISPHN